MHEALLRGLAPGGVMWLPAAGESLWPLLRDGDSLRVRRVASASELQLGDVAVVKRPDGFLVAHVVTSVSPLGTASTVGVADPQPLEALGVVTGFRRDGRVLPWPRGLSNVVRLVPPLALVARRVPGLGRVVRFVRRR
ncbi:MAG: hypothetical protein U0228_33475 [Myxococcaceae bacterium]